MSVIVVVKKNGKVAIASDSMIIESDDICVPGNLRNGPSKIHSINKSYVGITGDMAHHLVLKSIIKKYNDNLCFENSDQIFETLLLLHEILKEDYFLLEETQNSLSYEGSQIQGVVCSSSGIFSFHEDRIVTEYTKFWASGSGMEVALGALSIAYDCFDNAEEIARKAVSATCNLKDSCGEPIESFSIVINETE